MKLRDVMGAPPTSRAYNSLADHLLRKANREDKPLAPAAHLLQPKRKSQVVRRKTINLRAVAEVLEQEGLDPTVEIVRVLKDADADLSPDLRLKTLSTLLEYTQSKKKSLEISGVNGGPIKLEAMSSAELMKIAMAPPEVIDVEDAHIVGDDE